MPRLRIAAIDTDSTHLDHLQQALASLSDWPLECHRFAAIAPALAFAADQPCDLFLLGLAPDTDVAHAMQELQAQHGATPIVAMPQPGASASTCAALQAGAAGFLPRSADLRVDLAATLLAALRRGELMRSVRDQAQELQRSERALQAVAMQLQTCQERLAQGLQEPLAQALAAARNLVARPHAPATLSYRTTDLGALVVRAVRMRRQQHDDITLMCHVDNDVPQVSIDPESIAQVVHNLLGNALKFTPRGGRIRVLVANDPNRTEHVRIVVADSGCGIPARHLTNIFELQGQPSAGTAAPTGIGLGLHLCRELVARHGGDIGVESTEGAGSTFWFRLPCRAQANADSAAAAG